MSNDKENVRLWDAETDVVVVGYGAGGSAAALDARAGGSEVIIFERDSNGGGSLLLSGGVIYMGGGTALQKSLGIDDTREAMFNYLMAAAGYAADPELIGVYCDRSPELYDWLVKHGVEFKSSILQGKHTIPPTDDGLIFSGNEQQEPYKSIAAPAPRGHHAKGIFYTGPAVFNPLRKAVEASGIDIVTDTRVTGLIANEDGRVIGITAQTAEGEINVRARRGVILTTGGFGANKEMVAQHCPAYLSCGVLSGIPADDGSGIRMAQAAGADVRLMGEAIAYNALYDPHENLLKGMLINDKGQRYIAEDAYGDWVGEMTVRHFPSSHVIIDDRILSSIPAKARGGAAAIVEDLSEEERTTTSSVNEELRHRHPDLEKLIVAKADTVEELAKHLGIPPILLENNVHLYNKMAEEGIDLQFGKRPSFLQPLATPPFYALDYSPKRIFFVTKGGVKIDVNARALDPQNRPIPGLYCAGTVCSQVMGQHYAGSGTLIAQAMIFGRIAGKNAASQ